MNKEFTNCVADTEKVLQKLSSIAGIEYLKGSFENFENSFCNSGLNEDYYVLESEGLKVSVQLEKYEGYFFITINGYGPNFEVAKRYLESDEAST